MAYGSVHYVLENAGRRDFCHPDGPWTDEPAEEIVFAYKGCVEVNTTVKKHALQLLGLVIPYTGNNLPYKSSSHVVPTLVSVKMRSGSGLARVTIQVQSIFRTISRIIVQQDELKFFV